MKDGWIVIRKQDSIDTKYWVCENKEDALRIAREIAAYWREEYSPDEGDVDTVLYNDLIFCESIEDGYSVHVLPIAIRQAGEVEKEEFVVDKKGIRRLKI